MHGGCWIVAQVDGQVGQPGGVDRGDSTDRQAPALWIHQPDEGQARLGDSFNLSGQVELVDQGVEHGLFVGGFAVVAAVCDELFHVPPAEQVRASTAEHGGAAVAVVLDRADRGGVEVDLGGKRDAVAGG